MEKYFFTEQIAEKFKSMDKVPEWLQNYPEFRYQIKTLREALGMTQKQLSFKVKRTIRSIRQIENGEAIPKITTLKKIAEALNSELTISLIPRQNIIDLLDNLAKNKAKELISISEVSSTLEVQSPSKTESKRQIENLKNEILKKRRSILWTKKRNSD